MTKDKIEEVTVDLEARKVPSSDLRLKLIKKGYKLLEEGKFDEMEAKVFLEGEKIREQGKVVNASDIAKLAGIDEKTAKGIMWNIAKKVAYA